MDNRLVLGVLLVTLSWGFMNTATALVNSTTTMTVAGGDNATIPVAPAGGDNATAGGHNATIPVAPAGGHNATAGGHNATIPVAPAGGHNATAGGHNATIPVAPAGGHNATAGGHNATTPVAPAGGHNATTPVAVLFFPLVRPISRTGCRSQKLCGAEPSNCDPSSKGSCFFFSAQQKSNQTFEFELSGQSEGYIALSLSTDTTLGGNDTTYICVNNNGTVEFVTALLDNNKLTPVALSVSSANTSTNGSNIQCAFVATVPDSSSKATRAAGFSVSLLSGTFNATSFSFGVPMTRLQTNVVNLTNPDATVININANTTSKPTAHAVTHQQSLIQVLLVTVSVLVFTMLQRD